MVEKTKTIFEGVNSIDSFIKVVIPVFFLSVVKFMILIKDKKITKANAVLSFCISSILSITICYPLSFIVDTILLLVINSLLTFAGENLIRALIYKNDWDKIIDSFVSVALGFFKKWFGNGK